MALTPIYTQIGSKLFMAGCPLSPDRARRLLTGHTAAARTGPTRAAREADATLRDELVIAMARAVTFELETATLGLERIAAAMRALVRPDQRPGAVVISFQRRS